MVAVEETFVQTFLQFLSELQQLMLHQFALVCLFVTVFGKSLHLSPLSSSTVFRVPVQMPLVFTLVDLDTISYEIKVSVPDSRPEIICLHLFDADNTTHSVQFPHTSPVHIDNSTGVLLFNNFSISSIIKLSHCASKPSFTTPSSEPILDIHILPLFNDLPVVSITSAVVGGLFALMVTPIVLLVFHSFKYNDIKLD
ncbi:hypothetical protein GEMRC1_006454 [Eukaryota sp. GEM-RC1]